MCLILFAWQVHPDFPLVVAANRDEFFARPTAVADWWAEAPQVLAGRDLSGMGTWMGVSRAGRFAALTNYRDPTQMRASAPSRGPLVSDFLMARSGPEAYLTGLRGRDSAYNGYNLLLGDGQSLYWHSNVGGQIGGQTGSLLGGQTRALAPGVYGLSNQSLDSPWPKLVTARSALGQALGDLPDTAALFHLLRDDRTYPDERLPRTGVSLALERLLSAAFIRSPRGDYGTRCSTVMLWHRSGYIRYDEQSWQADAQPGPRRRFSFNLAAPRPSLTPAAAPSLQTLESLRNCS